MSDYKYCVVEYDVDEEGPITRTTLFYDLDEAVKFANECYGVVYKLEHV